MPILRFDLLQLLVVHLACVVLKEWRHRLLELQRDAVRQMWKSLNLVLLLGYALWLGSDRPVVGCTSAFWGCGKAQPSTYILSRCTTAVAHARPQPTESDRQTTCKTTIKTFPREVTYHNCNLCFGHHNSNSVGEGFRPQQMVVSRPQCLDGRKTRIAIHHNGHFCV